MSESQRADNVLKLFLCGDVMTGRGIDQILPHPSQPQLYEPFVTDARQYVELAREVSGDIKTPVHYSYIWGDALAALEREAPDLRLINLETSVTDSASPWLDKGIHYRMHPDNIGALTAAGVEGCALANNHVLDWDYPGLDDTLKVLERQGLGIAGAGSSLEQAAAPLVFDLTQGRRLLFVSCGLGSSGIPRSWSATAKRAGVFRLPDLSAASIDLLRQCLIERRPQDRVVVSIHWGGNWGHRISNEQQEFARALIDVLDVDLVHGHSSHHPRPLEVHRGKLILYGCGDFINDYEGIGGNEGYRGDLTLMYLPSLSSDGRLRSLRMVPMRMSRLQLRRATRSDTGWLHHTLNRISAAFGTGCELTDDGALRLVW